uniref:hAT-like transposase RNase-H fold domain-containing protein n=1 Tax=Cannabis sativa TaxID=3483 RepID=A0A803NHF2_CANSA
MTSATCNDTRISQPAIGQQPTTGETPLTNIDASHHDCSCEPKSVRKRKASRSLSLLVSDGRCSKMQEDPIDCEAPFQFCRMDYAREAKSRRELIARMLINGEFHLRCVESKTFKHLCEFLDPTFRVPSCVIAARDCLNLYVKEKNKLKNVLVDSFRSVCLSIDTWTSKQRSNYIRLTAHYVDSDWKTQKRILKFCQVPNHKVETIGKTVEMSLLEWNIEKVLTVTVSNASFSNGVVAYLSERITPVFKGEFKQMRCFPNILDLAVAEGLKSCHDSITKIKNVVKYVKASPIRLQKFKACVEQEKIISEEFVSLEVSNDWDSTYLMLVVVVEFERAFERLEKEDEHYFHEFVQGGRSPTCVDWEIAHTCVNHLKTFYNASMGYSKEVCATAELFLFVLESIHMELQSWSDSKDIHAKKMADNIRENFNKHWVNMHHVNPLLFVAVLLDPRCKEKGLRMLLHNICGDVLADEMTKKAKKTLESLYEHYSMLSTPLHLRKVTWRSIMDCPYKCKILPMIVQDVLAIPISESEFYSDGVVLNSSSNYLSSETIEAFVCARNWSVCKDQSSLYFKVDAYLNKTEMNTR